MSIGERIQGFIASEKSTAIAIKGKWGQGKTHFWNKIAREYAPAAVSVRPNYAYVSLFGLNSLSDLRAALAQNIRPVGMIDQDTFAALLDLGEQPPGRFRMMWQGMKGAGKGVRNRDWRSRARQHISGIGKGLADNAANASVGIPHIGNLGPLYRAYAYSKVRNALICVDDLERRGSGLMLKDVMGLISQLVTERSCSIAVILNDGTLEGDDKTVWDANREKVLSGELSYQTTPEICAGYIFTDAKLSYANHVARDAIYNLGLINVRIIERIKTTCDLVLASITFPISDQTIHHIVKCLVLLVYTYAGQGEGAPPILESKKNPLARAVERINNKEQKKEPSEDEQRWNVQLSKYNFHFFGEMDELLKDAVEHGYPDIDALHPAIKNYDAAIASDALDAEFGAAWELFHGTFTDNGADVISKMSAAFFNVVTTISSLNADSAIRLMRAFDEVALADRMVKEWVDARSGQRWQELGPREIEIFEPIQDALFKKAITNAYEGATVQHLPSFEEVMNRLTPNYYVSDDDLQSLCLEPIEGYVNYFRTHQGRPVGAAGRYLLTYDRTTDPERSKLVRGKARQTMERLAAESQANAVRIQWKYDDVLPTPD